MARVVEQVAAKAAVNPSSTRAHRPQVAALQGRPRWEVKMTKEKWDSLSVDQRKEAVLKYDTSGSMALPEWAPLLEKMVQPYDKLSKLQRDVVLELL